MGVVLAFANQKGGVGKTTSVHSIGDALHERGYSVLMIDLDPQACLTFAAGSAPDELDGTLHDVFTQRSKPDDVLVRRAGPDLLPSSIDLAGAEVHLLTKTGREHVLARAIAPLVPDYDVVLIDCAPALGVLTINGLTAADYVVIPFQADTLSHRGVGQLLETVDDVRSFTNEDLRVLGGIATMFDGRTRLSHSVLAEMTREHRVEVLDPPVPKSVRVAEAPGAGISVLAHASSSKPAMAYRELARHVEELI